MADYIDRRVEFMIVCGFYSDMISRFIIAHAKEAYKEKILSHNSLKLNDFAFDSL